MHLLWNIWVGTPCSVIRHNRLFLGFRPRPFLPHQQTWHETAVILVYVRLNLEAAAPQNLPKRWWKLGWWLYSQKKLWRLRWWLFGQKEGENWIEFFLQITTYLGREQQIKKLQERTSFFRKLPHLFAPWRKSRREKDLSAKNVLCHLHSR